MALTPTIRDGDWNSVRKAIQLLSSNLRLGNQAIPTFGGMTLNGAITAPNFISNIATDTTSPYACQSTILNNNLNADLLEGQHGAYYATATGYLKLDQTTPQTFTNFAGGTGLMKVTAGLLGLDTSTYLTTETDPVVKALTGIIKSSGTAIGTVSVSSPLDYTTGTLSLTQTSIANLNSALSTGFLKITTGTGLLSSDTNTYYKSGDSPSFVRGTFTEPTLSPFVIISNVVNTNLNADLWDGYQFSDYIDQAVKTTSDVIFNSAIIDSTGTEAFLVRKNADGGDLFVVDTTNSSVAIGMSVTGIEGLSVAKSVEGIGYGIYGSFIQTKGNSGALNYAGAYGLYFAANWVPTSLTGNRTQVELIGAMAVASATMPTVSSYTMTITDMSCFEPKTAVWILDAGTSGKALTATIASSFRANNPTLVNGATATTLCAFYDPGMTVGLTNWGLAINTQSYINANLSIGKATAPTVALDVTGASLISSTLGVTGLITATGGISLPAAANIALATTTGTKIGTAPNQLLGFYNTPPIVQPSGNILTALSNLGLVTSPTITETDPIVAAITGIVKSNGTTIGTVVSGTDIKTVNSTSLLGSGDITVQETLVSATNIKTVNSTTLLGSGDLAVQPTLVSETNIKTINGSSVLASGGLTLLTTSFVDRGDPSVDDFNLLSFTTDKTWRDLDLSSIVPTGAKVVLLKALILDDAAGSYIFFRKNGNSNGIAAGGVYTQVANITTMTDINCACDTNRVIEYMALDTTFTAIYVSVKGWWV